MRRAMVLAVVLASGCGSFFHHLSGPALRLDRDTYPHEVEYELLGTTTGKACGGVDSDAVKKGSSRDPAVNGPPALFEQAKYIAIGSLAGADGLVAVRSQVEEISGVLCVHVTGRGYKLLALRAVSGGGKPVHMMEPKL